MSTDELIEVLRACAGESEDVALDESVLDTDFAALGYDSLALLEITGHLRREYRVPIAEDAVGLEDSPRQLLTLVNDS
jgi:minimal PKS acyl carrier protein